MPTPTSDDIELSCYGARAALERLAKHRFPDENGDEAAGRVAAVETLWWVRLLAEQLAYPGSRLTGDGTDSDAAELVAAMRVVRNTVTHKVPIVSRQVREQTVPGKYLVPGAGVYPGSYTELRWIPADELPKPDPRHDQNWVQNKADYAEHVAGQPCYASLHRAVTWLTGPAPKHRSDGRLAGGKQGQGRDTR